MKQKQSNLFWGIILILSSLLLMHFFMQEVVAKCLIGFVVIAVVVLTIKKGTEIDGISDIITVILPEIVPVLIHWFSDIPFIKNINKLYTTIVQNICIAMGKEFNVAISEEMGVTITFVIILLIYEVLNCQKDRTAMKILRSSKDQDLKEKTFQEKSEMFCKTLQLWLEEINRETNWNESQFTPLEAEIEVDTKGKRKKKYEDLLKCLKSNHHHRTVYLVLGSPGAGKSVSMRKLCLDLLKESKKTQKIPVYINLKEWNENWNLEHMPEKKDLISFIRKSFEAKADFSTESFLNEYFQRMLDDGRWYFVFDSFDEMPCLMGKTNCQGLIDGISALLYQFMMGPNQSGGVVASRLYKAPSSALSATVTLKIQEFNDIKIKTMLKKYLIQYEDVIELLFNGREDLVSLCRNPFYLTLLINYITDKGLKLPKNQMELYHSFIEERIIKCADRLEREQMEADEIWQAAKELASFMQETEGCGLECSAKLLYQYRSEAYWKKIFGLLKYAKLCRVGGQEQSISFIHRRFQEFFLVENIIDKNQEIAYENYRDILSETGMRDALVLYCEVAEEQKAKEIANFCWQVIQNNINYANNIHNKETQELVSVLYFLKEAFCNRKEVLTEFEENFYQLVKKILASKKKISEENQNEDENYVGVDYVILLAVVNSVVLFSKKQLENIVLKVFRINNRWLNDIIMQNCRILDTLGYHMENSFVKYLAQMDIRMFLNRFFNIRFSLSILKEFKYISRMHSIIMTLNILSILITFYIGTLSIAKAFKYILHFNVNQIKNLEVLYLFSYNHTPMDIANQPNAFYLILFFASIWLIDLLIMRIIKIFGPKFIFMIVELCVMMLLLLDEHKIIILHIPMLILLIVTIVMSIVVIVIHDIKYYLNSRDKFFKTLKKQKIFILILFVPIIIVPLILTNKYILYIASILAESSMAVFFIVLFVYMVSQVLLYLKDYIWLRKHSIELKHMQRTYLENSLNTIHFDSIRYKYIDILLSQNIELEGNWTNDIRPQYMDDKVNHALAKLDCIKLKSCDYLF